jgi:hypothetical protein
LPPPGADQRLDLLLVHAPVAAGDDQHRRVVALAAKDDALGDLAHADAQRIGRLLRRARGVVQHHRRCGWPAACSARGDALHAIGQRGEFGCAFSQFLAQAFAARPTISRLAPMPISTPPNTRFCARRARAERSQRRRREARKA